MVTEALRTSRLPSGCWSTLRLGAALLSAGFALLQRCRRERGSNAAGTGVQGEDGAWGRWCVEEAVQGELQRKDSEGGGWCVEKMGCGVLSSAWGGLQGEDGAWRK